MDTATAAPVETRTSLKAICARKDLFEGVQTVGHAVSGRTSLPILNHILVQAQENSLRLMASDTELTIALSIPARVEEGGGLTAPGRILTELLGSLPESDVALSVDRSHAVRVHCDRSDYKILGLPAEEYPRLPEVKDENRFVIGQRLLKEMIRQTIFAVSTDEARAILTGILMVFEGETLKFVATDTHRLAVRSATVKEGQGSHQVIVPARAMNELQRILTDADGDVLVRISDNQILFETPGGEGGRGITLISNLIQGQFPNYQRVIPTGFQKKLTLQTGPFQKAVRRASIVARNNANRVILRTQDDKLTITAESSLEGAAYEEIEFVREGDDVEIAFNAKYLLDVLGVMDAEGLNLELTESLKPGVVRPISATEGGEPDEYICILMPMQIV
jgi:DNA polymerase III subunit beta